MRSLEDSQEKLLWEGLWEGCLGRQDDRGLGHPEGTQRRTDGTQKEETMGVTLPAHTEAPDSYLSYTRNHMTGGNFRKEATLEK